MATQYNAALVSEKKNKAMILRRCTPMYNGVGSYVGKNNLIKDIVLNKLGVIIEKKINPRKRHLTNGNCTPPEGG